MWQRPCHSWVKKETEMWFLETMERANFDSGIGQVDEKDRHRENFWRLKAKYKLEKQAWGSRLQGRCQPGGPTRWRGWTPRDSNRDHSRYELHVDLFVDQFPQDGGLGFPVWRNFWALRTRWVAAQIQTTNLDTRSSFNSKMVKRFWSNIAGSF